MIFKHPVYHLSFSSKYYMNATMLRIGEAYPNGMPAYPTYEEALDFRWHHVYLTRWNGMALQVKDALSDLKAYQKTLIEKEKRLYALLKQLDPKGLLLCTACDCRDTALVPHELVHAAYAQHKKYSTDVEKTVKSLEYLPILNDSLVYANYIGLENDCDEINAYALTGRYKKMERNPQHKAAWKKAEAVLHPLFEQHFGFSIRTHQGRQALYSQVIPLGALI